MNWKKFRFSWLLAKRDIFQEKKVSTIVVAMLAFSFLNLVFFPAFISGLSDLFTQNIIETQTGDVVIEPETGKYIRNAESTVKKVESFRDVRDVEKRLITNRKLYYGRQEVETTLIGIEHMNPELYRDRMDSGEVIGPEDSEKIVLGLFIAENNELTGTDGLGVREGRNIEMEGAEQKFKVKGVIGIPGPGSLVEQSFIPYEYAERLLQVDDSATSIKIMLEEEISPADFKQKLKSFNTQGDISTWWEVSDLTANIESTFNIVTAVVSIVGLIIAVTSVGVVIFINSTKRKREMGIVRSIGTESSTVLTVFMMEAVFFGIAGVILGAGIMVGAHTYLVNNPINAPIGSLSTVLTPELLYTRAAWMLVASAVAGFIPAYMVSKLSIIDTIEAR